MNPHRLTITNSSRKLQVLGFVRSYFRQHGASPSFAEVAAGSGISKQRVGRYTAELQQEGVLVVTGRARRAIALIDRGDNLSDDELELTLRRRGWPDRRSVLPQLADAFTVEPGLTETELHLLDVLDHIDAATSGG